MFQLGNLYLKGKRREIESSTSPNIAQVMLTGPLPFKCACVIDFIRLMGTGLIGKSQDIRALGQPGSIYILFGLRVGKWGSESVFRPFLSLRLVTTILYVM